MQRQQSQALGGRTGPQAMRKRAGWACLLAVPATVVLLWLLTSVAPQQGAELPPQLLRTPPTSPHSHSRKHHPDTPTTDTPASPPRRKSKQNDEISPGNPLCKGEGGDTPHSIHGVKGSYPEHAVLEHAPKGASVWGPGGTSAMHVGVKPVVLRTPGRYCVARANRAKRCLEDASVFAVTSPGRKGTEYGVAPLPPPPHPLPHIGSLAQLRGVVKGEGVRLSVSAPWYLPPDHPVPLFVTVKAPRHPAEGAGAGAGGKNPTPAEWLRMPFVISVEEVCGDAPSEGVPTFALHRGVTGVWGLRPGVTVPRGETERPSFAAPEGPQAAFFCLYLQDPGAEAGFRRTSAPLPLMFRREPSSGKKRISWEEALHAFDSHAGGHARNTIYLVEVVGEVEVPLHVTVRFPPSAVLLLGEGAIVRVHGALALMGVPERPVVITPADPGKPYAGIQVEGEGRLIMKHVIATGSGATAPRLKDTGKHRKEHPLVSAHGDVEVEGLHAMQLSGPGFGLGAKSEATVSDSFLIGLQQGGECVHCTVTLTDTYIGSLPDDNRERFVDGDNDGFYFRGGRAKADGLVVVNSKDDCIDTASSKGHPGGFLEIRNSILEHCWHEGVALSGSVMKDARKVDIMHTVIKGAQQGVEAGYSPASHAATLSNSVLLGNVIGVRHGDNYNLKVEGSLDVSRTIFQGNGDDVVNLVKSHNAAHPGKLRISECLLAHNHSRRFCGVAQWEVPDGGAESTIPDAPHVYIDPLTLAVVKENDVFDSVFSH